MKLVESTLQGRTLKQFRSAHPELFDGMEAVSINKIEDCPTIHVICRASDAFQAHTGVFQFSEVSRIYTRPGYDAVEFFARHRNIKVVQVAQNATKNPNLRELCEQLEETVENSRYFTSLKSNSRLVVMNGGRRMKKLPLLPSLFKETNAGEQKLVSETWGPLFSRVVHRREDFLISGTSNTSQVFSLPLKAVKAYMDGDRDEVTWSVACNLVQRRLLGLLVSRRNDVFMELINGDKRQLQFFRLSRRGPDYLALNPGKSVSDERGLLGGIVHRVVNDEPIVVKDAEESAPKVSAPDGIPCGFHRFLGQPEL
jgi:hypothetical protein